MRAEAVVETMRREQPVRRGFPVGARFYLLWLWLAAAAFGGVLAGANRDSVRWVDFAVVLVAAAVVQSFAAHTTKHQMFHAGLTFTIAAALVLPPEYIAIVCIVQHIPDWVRHRYPWYIQTFNVGNYVVSALAAWAVWHALTPGMGAANGRLVCSAVVAAAVFVAINHTLLARMLVLARGRSVRESGLFALDSLLADVVLGGMGVAFAFTFRTTPWLAPLIALPIVLIHRALVVPTLREQVFKDHKTGVLNSRGLEQAGDEELTRARRFDRPISVLMIDVDGLREINNGYGHLAGDAALVAIAKAMIEELREYDICGRFGGDEFVAVLPETGLGDAVVVGERIARAIQARSVETDRGTVQLRVSIGAAMRSDESRLCDLLERADTAMYAAKGAGGAAVHASA
jgi:diguanylate cyclase (GGDEF)-like protein